MTRDKWEQKVEETAKLLKTRPYTARTLAARLKIAFSSAKRRILAVGERYPLRVKGRSEGKRGPASDLFYLD